MRRPTRRPRTTASASCSDVDVFFTRGTGELSGVSIAGTPFTGAFTPDLPGKTVSAYAADYEILSPVERAAFVLDDVFGMAPRTAADIWGGPRTDGQVHAVREAFAAQDTDRLTTPLAADAAAFFDGPARYGRGYGPCTAGAGARGLPMAGPDWSCRTPGGSPLSPASTSRAVRSSRSGSSSIPTTPVLERSRCPARPS
ncbi:hypothetical protein [Streptomyces sp. NPDC017964]|uniref:hypothetical protein n=1 Tax=Streptomyces sp. NPDC017964 TaxID=3365022 RepID=UPI00379686C2